MGSSEQQYTKQFFKELAENNREKALRVAKEFERQGATRLMDAHGMSKTQLGCEMWEFYLSRTRKPKRRPKKSKGPRKPLGRPSTDWDSIGRPFLEGTRLGIMWDCIMRNPQVNGFEDRVRVELMAYRGPLRGPSVLTTPIWNLFAFFFQASQRRGFKISVMGNPSDGSSQYKIVRIGNVTPRWKEKNE